MRPVIRSIWGFRREIEDSEEANIYLVMVSEHCQDRNPHLYKKGPMGFIEEFDFIPGFNLVRYSRKNLMIILERLKYVPGIEKDCRKRLRQVWRTTGGIPADPPNGYSRITFQGN